MGNEDGEWESVWMGIQTLAKVNNAYSSLLKI